jgi:hypothetical protein
MIFDHRKWVGPGVLMISLLAVVRSGRAAMGFGGAAALPQTFSNPRISSAITAIRLNFFAMAGVYFFMSFYRQNARGYDYHSLSRKMPIVALESIYLLQRMGIGIVMPTVTESVMSVVPRERVRAGSATTRISRPVALALSPPALSQPALAEE